MLELRNRKQENIWMLLLALPCETDAGFSLCSFLLIQSYFFQQNFNPSWEPPSHTDSKVWSFFKKDLTCSSGFFHVRGTKGRQMWKTSQGNLFDGVGTKGEYGGVETPKDKLSSSHLAHTWFSNQAQIKVTNTCTWFSFNPVSSSQHSSEYSLLNRNAREPKENFL